MFCKVWSNTCQNIGARKTVLPPPSHTPNLHTHHFPRCSSLLTNFIFSIVLNHLLTYHIIKLIRYMSLPFSQQWPLHSHTFTCNCRKVSGPLEDDWRASVTQNSSWHIFVSIQILAKWVKFRFLASLQIYQTDPWRGPWNLHLHQFSQIMAH